MTKAINITFIKTRATMIKIKATTTMFTKIITHKIPILQQFSQIIKQNTIQANKTTQATHTMQANKTTQATHTMQANKTTQATHTMQATQVVEVTHAMQASQVVEAIDCDV